MKKQIVIMVIALSLFGCASSANVDTSGPDYIRPTVDTFEPDYIPPTVEDTPQFKRLKALVEADGYPYSHYEVGAGLQVWGRRDNANGGWESRGWGSKDEGIISIPGGDESKAYYTTWDQYFKAFSDMYTICFTDKNVRQIKQVIDQLVLDTDYDFPQLYKLPAGAQWEFHPGVKYKGACDDYADLVTEKISGLPGVQKVIKVSSRIGNHAWNEIWLNDGRILFCDATWYDTNSYYVDSKTGNYVIEHEPCYMPTMFTFDKQLFSLGNTHYNWGDATNSSP